MVVRQQNWLGQQRVDIPHLRALEAASAYDFDVLAGTMLAGGKAYVLTGFELISVSPGTAATALQLRTAASAIIHPQSSENGSIFYVPSSRALETLNAANTRVQGSFTPNATNYVGVDLRRAADSTTADQVQFINPGTKQETPKDVPLARTMDYVIVISAQDFGNTPNVAPIANVTTDSLNNITSLVDARNFMFRLGSGGSIPDPLHVYDWPRGRTEVGDDSDFEAADKAIGDLKTWLDAAMTRMWELGGGEHWYSQTADRNVRMTRTGTSFTNGEWFEWDGTNLHWRGLKFVFDNSTASYNDVKDQLTSTAGLTDLADGDCVYIDLDRTTDRTGGTALQPVKTPWITLGTPAVPGSRYIIAWRVGTAVYTRDSSFPVGSTFTVATTTALGIVKLHQASLTPLAPVVLSDGDLGTANGVLGLNANLQAILTATTGDAMTVTGGSGDGTGVKGIGGGTNGIGVHGVGLGSGVGVKGVGSAGGSAGVYGESSVSNGYGVRGLGVGGNAYGGFFQGSLAGAGLQAMGGTAGPALVTQKSVSTNKTPQVQYQDSLGNMRSGVDHNGFPTGRYSHFREEWINPIGTNTTTGALTSLASYNRWQYHLGGVTGSVFQVMAWDTNQHFRGMGLTSTSSASSATAIGLDSNCPILKTNATNSGTTWYIEFPVVADGVVGADFKWGMDLANNSLVIGNGNTGIYFRKSSTDTNIQCCVGNAGTTTVVDSGVVLNSNGIDFQVFRIEWYGQNSDLGGPRVVFYINGQLVASVSTNLPTGIAVGYIPAASVNYVSAQRSLYLGPFVAYWAHSLSPPVL